MLRRLQSTEVLPGIWTEPPESQFVHFAFCPGTGHHWKEPGSFLFATSLQVLIDIYEILPELAFSRLNWRVLTPGPSSFSWPLAGLQEVIIQ